MNRTKPWKRRPSDRDDRRDQRRSEGGNRGPNKRQRSSFNHRRPSNPFVKLPPVDRSKQTPLLVKAYVKTGPHHDIEDLIRPGQHSDEIQLYTWKDATLKELCEVIKPAVPAAQRPDARFSFSFIFPGRNGRFNMRQKGLVHASRASNDDLKALRELQFQTGDLISVAIQ